MRTLKALALILFYVTDIGAAVEGQPHDDEFHLPRTNNTGIHDRLEKVAVCGKIVDLEGNPVPDAELKISWNRIAVRKGFFDYDPVSTWIKSDVKGEWSYTINVPNRAYVEDVKRAGYEYSTRYNQDNMFKDIVEHKVTTNTPIVTVLRKIGETTFLVHRVRQHSTFACLPHSQTNGLDLLQERPDKLKSDSYSDIQVAVNWLPFSNGKSITLSSPNGPDGLIVGTNLLYQAPQEGYLKEVSISEPPWRLHVYLKSRTPPIYSRLDLTCSSVNWSGTNQMFVITYDAWVNPSGERNLEYDQRLDQNWRVEQELTRAALDAIKGHRHLPKPDIPQLIKTADERVERERAEKDRLEKVSAGGEKGCDAERRVAEARQVQLPGDLPRTVNTALTEELRMNNAQQLSNTWTNQLVELISRFNPTYLLLSAFALMLLGMLCDRVIPKRWGWQWMVAWIIPVIVLLYTAGHNKNNVRVNAPRISAIFDTISRGQDLTDGERTAFQNLTRSSPQVKEGVMRLAFANWSNAATALPRLDILLQAVLQLDPTGNDRNRLWKHVVRPALRNKPPCEVVLLAAATAATGGYGSNQVESVLQPLRSLIENETDSETRDLALSVFAPLVEFAPQSLAETCANLMLKEVLDGPNMMQESQRTYRTNSFSSRRVRDLCRVAARLSGEQARRYGDRLISEIGSQTNVMRVVALGKVLLEIKTELTPRQVDLALANLLQQLQCNPGYDNKKLATPLAGLIEVSDSNQSARTLNRLLLIMRNEQDWRVKSELARMLKPLVQRLSAEDVQRFIAEPMASLFPDVVEQARDRISQEQAYLWLDRLVQSIIKTGTRSGCTQQLSCVSPLAARLTPERTGKLANELWTIICNDNDTYRCEVEEECLIAIAPHLDDEHATSLAGRVAMQMIQQKRINGIPRLMWVLTPMLVHCNSNQLKDVVAGVVAPFERSRIWLEPVDVAQREFMLGAHFTPEQTNKVLEPLVTALEECDGTDTFIAAIRNVNSLYDLLTLQQNERVADLMVDVFMQNKLNSRTLYALLKAGANIKVTPCQAMQMLEVLFSVAIDDRPPRMDIVAKCAGPFLNRLTLEQAEAYGQLIISTMRQSSRQMFAALDEKCLLPLTNVLGPDQARRLTDQLQNIPALRESPYDLMGYSHRGPDKSSDWMLPSVFIECQEGLSTENGPEPCCRSLAALLSRMDKKAAGIIADQVAARYINQGEWGPVPFEERTATVLQYASEPTLKRILQCPFTVGGLRLMALRALELKTGNSFHGDKWKYAASLAVAKTL